MQYLTLALDASCDLPEALYQRFELATLPLAWLAPTTLLPPDDRSAAVTRTWYGSKETLNRQWLPNLSQDDHLGQRLNDHWLLHSDGALLLTPAKHRHPGYQHWHRQAATLQPQLLRIRRAANLQRHFRLRVLDSGHTLAAYGLLAQELARLHRDQGLTIDKLRRPLLALAPRIQHYYSVPAFRTPAPYPEAPAFPGINRINQTLMASRRRFPVFRVYNGEEQRVHYATPDDPVTPIVEQVTETLETSPLSHPAVNVSFAGQIDPLRQHPAIRQLHHVVSAQGGHLWLSPMAGSSAWLFGHGALSVALVN